MSDDLTAKNFENSQPGYKTHQYSKPFKNENLNLALNYTTLGNVITGPQVNFDFFQYKFNAREQWEGQTPQTGRPATLGDMAPQKL